MAYNKSVEEFRDIEYPMMQGNIYLDHSGTTIYAKSLITQFSQKLLKNLYGNPHSASTPSHLSTQEITRVREQTLRFFHADPEYFDIIFTANATAAIKLVADSFRDLGEESKEGEGEGEGGGGGFWYAFHKDAHTSLVGVRELAYGGHCCFSSNEEVEDWLAGNSIPKKPAGVLGLFAYPGQSNMTGQRLPLSWPSILRHSNIPEHQETYSLLDAAALATTTQLSFSPDTAPDFTALSFYKIFGFPDLGALIVRKKSGHVLAWRKYYGGGTVNMLTVFQKATVQRKDITLHDALEDGTLPFHNVIALGCALDVHERLYGSMEKISRHTSFLAERVYVGIEGLRHASGYPVCEVYTRNTFQDSRTQGATIAFNMLSAKKTYIPHSLVESLANDQNIYLRSGGLCNPGGIASHLKIEQWQFKRAWSAGYRCSDAGPLEIINGKPMGVVRVSLGAMSTISDVDTFLRFLEEVFVEGGVVVESVKGERETSGRGERLQYTPPATPISRLTAASKPSLDRTALRYQNERASIEVKGIAVLPLEYQLDGVKSGHRASLEVGVTRRENKHRFKFWKGHKGHKQTSA